MPVEGFPDPDAHEICRRCGRWHEPYEGVLEPPAARGPVARIGMTLSGVAGLGRTPRSVCHRCRRVERRGRIAVWLVFFLLVAAMVFFALRWTPATP